MSDPGLPSSGDGEIATSSRYLGASPPVPRSSPPVSVNVSSPSTRRLSTDESLALWLEYRRTNSAGLRDRLVLTFAPMVKYIVYRKVREMPANAEVEDFISCGLEALIVSIDRYDPEKG